MPDQQPPHDRPPRDGPPRDSPPRDRPPQDSPPRDGPTQGGPPRGVPPRDRRSREADAVRGVALVLGALLVHMVFRWLLDAAELGAVLLLRDSGPSTQVAVRAGFLGLALAVKAALLLWLVHWATRRWVERPIGWVPALILAAGAVAVVPASMIQSALGTAMVAQVHGVGALAEVSQTMAYVNGAAAVADAMVLAGAFVYAVARWRRR